MYIYIYIYVYICSPAPPPPPPPAPPNTTSLKGYLAHKKTPIPLGPPYAYAYGRILGACVFL